MDRSVKRPRNLPGKYSDEEMKVLEDRAKDAGFSSLAAYVRKRLGLKPVPFGRPKGSPNRKKEGE